MFPQKIWGGGSAIDYANPDVTSTGYINHGNSLNIATTKKARLIVTEFNIKASTGNSPVRRLMVYEVGKGGTQLYINSSGQLTPYTIDADGKVSGVSLYIVTDNQVTVVNYSASVDSYQITAIYY